MMSSAVIVYFFLAGVAMIKGDHIHEFMISNGIEKFSWSNCDKTAKYHVNFTEISLSPDVIHPGSVAKVSFTAMVDETIGITRTLQVDVEAKFDTYGTTIDVCDYFQCHYKDFCGFIRQYQNKCPPVVSKLVPKCQCPLKQQTYKVTDEAVQIPSVGIQLDGVFHLKINVTESNKQIGCLKVTVGVK